MEPELLVEDAEGIRTVTLNRPQAMNALTDTLRQARSGSLTLTLSSVDRMGTPREERVARVTQAWSPAEVVATWNASGTLQIRWHERLTLSKHYA